MKYILYTKYVNIDSFYMLPTELIMNTYVSYYQFKFYIKYKCNLKNIKLFETHLKIQNVISWHFNGNKHIYNLRNMFGSYKKF